MRISKINLDSLGEDSPLLFVLLLAGLVLLAYWPAIGNGFIADDYVMLERAGDWDQNPINPFSHVPERISFRLTSYACFTLLKKCFGYHAGFYYAFTILLHLANAVMLWKYVRLVSGSAIIAGVTSALFATMQNPQEAVMWLTAMNDNILGACVLATLLLWAGGRRLWSWLPLTVGLFSKESGFLILFLVPLMEFVRTRKLTLHREYAVFVLPTLIFAALFLWEGSRHPFLVQKSYAFTSYAFLVLPNSAHRLSFPWLYAAIIMAVAASGWRSAARHWGQFVWMVLSLAPYVFLTYQSHVPSRNQYIAAMGCAWLIALLLREVPNSRLRRGFIVLFVAVNVGYLWHAKEPQYKARAAPTSELMAELRARPPQRLRVVGFPYEVEWIAKDVALLVPGWRPDMLLVNEPESHCPGCSTLTWDATELRYR